MKPAARAIVLSVLLVSAPVAAGDFSGPVLKVRDGDTLEVDRRGKTVFIGLQRVDAPDIGQIWSDQAKAFTQELALGKIVTVHIVRDYRDRYGRIHADVTLPDGRDLGQELVRAGWAMWFRREAKDDPVLPALEREAREAHRGVWYDPDPEPPWEYRDARENARGLGIDLPFRSGSPQD